MDILLKQVGHTMGDQLLYKVELTARLCFNVLTRFDFIELSTRAVNDALASILCLNKHMQFNRSLLIQLY